MKNEISMQSVKTLFKLDLKSRFGSTQKRGAKYRILQALNIFFFAAVYAVLIMGMYYLTKVFVERSYLRLEFLVLIAMLTMIIATVVSTSTVIKNLYQNGDNELLLRFPVSGGEIMISKSIYCFLHNLAVCALIMLPFYFTFGAVTNAIAGDYFSYIAVTLLSSFVPFFVANIIAVPVMKLTNALKNKFVLVLILTIIILCVAFVLYLVALNSVLTYMRDSRQEIFSPEMIARYKAFARGAYPFRWYAELINGARYGSLSSGGLALRFLYIFLMTAALGVLSCFITVKEYYKTILYGMQSQKATVGRKVKDKQTPVILSMLTKEFYLILRSSNYSFQYLAMACAAPLMVFFCNRLAASMGTETIGTAIMPGIMIMVIIIFVTISVSFASTCISREGNCFYQTKTIPVPYRTQILVKFLLYSIVASLSVALCCLVSGIYYTTEAGGKVLTAVDVGAIWGIAQITVISLTSLSIYVDIKMPTFNVSGDGELVAANKNVALTLALGILISILFGVVLMVCNFLPISIGTVLLSSQNNLGNIYLLLTAFSLILLAVSLTLLLRGLDKNYRKIVP